MNKLFTCIAFPLCFVLSAISPIMPNTVAPVLEQVQKLPSPTPGLTPEQQKASYILLTRATYSRVHKVGEEQFTVRILGGAFALYNDQEHVLMIGVLADSYKGYDIIDPPDGALFAGNPVIGQIIMDNQVYYLKRIELGDDVLLVVCDKDKKVFFVLVNFERAFAPAPVTPL